jgi:MraZ protein
VFTGSFRHTLDSAGRFVMPKRFRYSLGQEFVITKGLGCLCVFPTDFVNKILAPGLEALGSGLEALLNPDIVRLTRHYFSNMEITRGDNQNRVPLTPEHRRYAGIEDEVVICGCGNYIEIWSPQALQEYEEQNDRVEDLIASGAALRCRMNSQASTEQNAGVSSAGTS